MKNNNYTYKEIMNQVDTLELVYEDYLTRKSENINGSEIILEHMIKQYGYGSLEQANKALMDRT